MSVATKASNQPVPTGTVQGADTVVLGEWIKKDNKEKIRISRRTYNGKQFYDLRVYYVHEETQEWRPTKEGFTFPIDQWEEFAYAVRDADEWLENNR